MHQLPNAIDGDAFASPCHAAFKASPCSDQNFSKSCGKGPFLVPDPMNPPGLGVGDRPGPAHVHRPPWSEWFAQRPGDGETWSLEMLETSSWKGVSPSFWNAIYICAWIVVVSLRAILATCHTCRWQERAYSPMKKPMFHHALGDLKTTCRILTQVSLPQSDCFSLSCLAKPQACKSQWYSLPFFLSTKSWKPFSKSQIPCKKVSFFAA